MADDGLQRDYKNYVFFNGKCYNFIIYVFIFISNNINSPWFIIFFTGFKLQYLVLKICVNYGYCWLFIFKFVFDDCFKFENDEFIWPCPWLLFIIFWLFSTVNDFDLCL